MKYLVLTPSGAVDEPLDELEGRTPLAAATLPVLNELASRARLGTARLAPPGEHTDSAWARASLLGHDPERMPIARGPLEALARGIRLGRRDRAFRLNFVTANKGVLTDPTAGHISTTESERLLADLRLIGTRFELHLGDGHRHLLVWRECGPLSGLRTYPPQAVLHALMRRFLPSGRDSRPLAAFMREAGRLLAGHEINTVRQDLGESPATDIWVWGHGQLSAAPSIEQRFGVRGVLLSDAPLMRGLGRFLRLDARPLSPRTSEGEDGSAAPTPESIRRSAEAALDGADLVIVHVGLIDTISHRGDAAKKVAALEALDRELVGPLVERLRREEDWRLLVIPDHGTSLRTRSHLDGPTIFLLTGSDVETDRGGRFDEAHAREGEMHLERGSELFEYFLRR